MSVPLFQLPHDAVHCHAGLFIHSSVETHCDQADQRQFNGIFRLPDKLAAMQGCFSIVQWTHSYSGSRPIRGSIDGHRVVGSANGWCVRRPDRLACEHTGIVLVLLSYPVKLCPPV
eukprot:scpid107297/ scgid6868/ 